MEEKCVCDKCKNVVRFAKAIMEHNKPPIGIVVKEKNDDQRS